MVTSENGNTMTVSHFECHQQCYRFQRIIPAIHVISHEQIIGIRALSTNPEQFTEVIKLSMNITADSYGSLDCLDVGLVLQNCFGLKKQRMVVGADVQKGESRSSERIRICGGLLKTNNLTLLWSRRLSSTKREKVKQTLDRDHSK